MFWPEEESVTVVPMARVLDGSSVGEECRVKMGRAFYTGKIKAVGKLLHVHHNYPQHLHSTSLHKTL